MKTIVTTILAIILSIFAMAGAIASAAEPEAPSAGTAVAVELSEIPDGYDADSCPASYVIAIAE